MLRNRFRQEKERKRKIALQRASILSTSLATPVTFMTTPTAVTLAATQKEGKQSLSAEAPAGVLSYLGNEKPVYNAQGKAAALPNKLGLWHGGSSVQDGNTSFITGHNIDSFSDLNQLKLGDAVSYTDTYGGVRYYKVEEIIFVNNKGIDLTSGENRMGDIMNLQGEGLVLETCEVDDGSVLRIVIAK